MKKNGKTMPVIVFDLGGVLMDWDPYYLYSKILGDDRQAVDRFLKTVDFSGWNREQDRGRSFAEGTAELIARFPEYSELIRAYDERYLESLGGAVLPVVEILRALKDAGYPLYGLSNWPAEKFALVRPRYPFFEWFDDLVISGEVGLVKPDTAIFNLLLERVRHPAYECLFIDDHNSNISAARDLGFQTILFQSPQQLEAELRRIGILDQFSHSIPT
jgi:2-haloacid dehalogenase